MRDFVLNLLPTPLTPATYHHRYDIRTVQELIGHKDVTTVIYTPVPNRGSKGDLSPADSLLR